MEDANYLQRFLIAALVPALAAISVVGVSVFYFREYGLVLFVVLPVFIGFLSTVLYGRDKLSRVFSTVFFSLLFTGVSLIAFAFEGAICLAMAFPLAFAMALGGSLLGTLAWTVGKNSLRAFSLLIFLFLPCLLGFESSNKSAPTVHKVVSTVEINAPIETVWQTVVAFPQIETAPEGILRLGFAYPINAKIDGAGVGAIRYCNFNTGAFVEPITIWQAPNLLAFDVKEQPAPMIEASPHEHLQAAHLGYIKSRRGQFQLYERGGKTVVEGTTFYTHDIAPDFYWNIFSDRIIHQIHLREVLAECELTKRAEVFNRQFEELPKLDVSWVSCRALDKFAQKLPKLLKWSGDCSLLFYGGNALRDELEKYGVKFEEKLLPMSEQRFLFVSAK